MSNTNFTNRAIITHIREVLWLFVWWVDKQKQSNVPVSCMHATVLDMNITFIVFAWKVKNMAPECNLHPGQKKLSTVANTLLEKLRTERK